MKMSCSLVWIHSKIILCFSNAKDATNQIRVSALDGTSNVRYVNFPEPTYYFELTSNPDFNTNLLRFKYSSLITPTSVVDFHMDTGEWELKKENKSSDTTSRNMSANSFMRRARRDTNPHFDFI